MFYCQIIFFFETKVIFSFLEYEMKLSSYF